VYATSFNFGPLLGGTSIRFRLYSIFGLKPTDIFNIVSMLMVMFWLGICSISAVVFLLAPTRGDGAEVGTVFEMPLRLFGVLAAVAVGGYLALNALRREPIGVGQLTIRLPGLPLALEQVLLASLDLIVAAGVLWVLLPEDLQIDFLGLLTGYLLAVLATAFSQVPGGLGVFELVVLSYAVPEKSPAAVGALVIYRLVYYLLPLLAATATYFAGELRGHGRELEALRQGFARWGGPVLPGLLALLTFVSGAILLFTGATPEIPSRLHSLERLLPLGVLEMSHLVGSLVGTLLLVLSRGLARRYDSAWAATSALVAVGIVAVLVRGFDLEEAILLGFVLFLLIASRRQFYRHGSLLHPPLSWSWLTAIFMAVFAAIWLGIFAYKHVEYSNDLWWQVAYRAEAPRFLRASLVSVVTLLLVAISSLFRGARPQHAAPTTDDLAAAAHIIAQQSSADALLALVGDKSLLFNEDRSAFLMYATQGRSWIALGDPVGPQSEWTSLAWSFHELVDAHGRLTVFYHIPAKSLPAYLQLGLTPIKVGDFGRVPLNEFTYEGPKFKELRQVRHRYDRAGFVFAILARKEVPPVLPRLREISHEWLADKNTAEKRFSVGYFSESYLSQTPIAVVKRGGEIFAFANVLATETKDELSIDLMRHVADVPNGIMDYLFGQLMQWGKDNGFKWFSLGMSPLSGLESRRLAPLWNRIGNAVYRHGEYFYNFEGLRQYKEKFHPSWEPYYLLYPGGLSLSRVLLDLAALTSGGMTRAITKGLPLSKAASAAMTQ
jgi:phosphatidylglycerol lysyltransferase